jgi:poly-beta-hydroxyalkanoate depolymerase
MEARDSPHVPASMTLMGGPIDTRRSPTKVNLLAQERGSAWFKRNCICAVPRRAGTLPRYSTIDEGALSAKQGRSFRSVQRFPFPQ